MKRKIAVFAVLLASIVAAAQQAPVASPLLDHLTGHWVLRGAIAGKQTTHDVDAEWVIQHHYLRLHEVSREKDVKGHPQYEAIVFIGRIDTPKTYTCVWLDIFGGASIASIGVAEPTENELPFIFKDEKGEVSLTNDFVYDPTRSAWEWRIDNVAKGVAKPFARVKLTRR
ncbi:MAG: hypothetical protein WB919_20265 [Candidatus Sulfotelmatobacter sp.]